MKIKMKTKQIFIVCVLFFVSISSFSQNYIPFVKEGKMWTEKTSPSAAPIYSIKTYQMKGDTIILSNLYKKIINSQNTISCYIREDTITQQVYCRQNNGYEFLLYDFALQIGDTLQGEDCITVSSVSTELFAGSIRRKICINYGFITEPMIWYEGIGSNVQGIFAPKCIVGAYTWLLCYLENDSLLYHDNLQNNDCFILTSTFSLEPETNLTNYSSNNILYVKTDDDRNYSLTIYDIYGKKGYKGNFSGNFEMNFSYLPTGMYVYKITCQSTKQAFVNKIIIN
ncbi:MAG TPA: hypothetical protein DEH02_04095 [Bacteroidales bacterium]|nr:MAG: hypothetical protein A2X01_17455 [Bacteroidetes bacterium GWF2_35_48]HBX50235.1 hypothetical protein [Bacteroidales bacterium]